MPACHGRQEHRTRVELEALAKREKSFRVVVHLMTLILDCLAIPQCSEIGALKYKYVPGCARAKAQRRGTGARSGVLVPARHSLRAMESHPITRGSDEADSDAEPPARAASHAVSRAAVELEEVCTPRASEADAPSTPEPPSQAPSMTRSCCINPRRSSGGGEIRRVSFAGDDGACPQRGGAGGPASEGGEECRVQCSKGHGHRALLL